MLKYIALVLVASVPAVVLGCSSSDSKGSGSNGGTDAGESAGADDGGASSAGHGGSVGGKSGASGTSAAAGDAGEGGEGGTSAGGSVSGSGNTSGAGNSSGHANGGQGGSAGTGGSPELGLKQLLGPVTDDQQPIVVNATHAGFPRSSYPFQVDANGNLFFYETSAVTKYSPSFQKLWSVTLSSLLPGATTSGVTMSLASDGGVFLGGYTSVALAGETHIGGGDAVVAKITAEGTLAWMHQWGSAVDELTTVTAPLPDGGVIAGGSCSGQAPGNPSTVTGGPWLARYTASGARTWLKQYVKDATVEDDSPLKLVADAAGNLYSLGSRNVVRKTDSDGNELSTSTIQLTDGVATLSGPSSTSALLPALDGKTFYTFGSFFATSTTVARNGLSLTQYAPDWTIKSYRLTEPTRVAVLDPVENVIWNGDFRNSGYFIGNAARLAFGTDSFFVSGYYQNSYMNGSVPKPTTTPPFVARYDSSGNRIWFQEITTAESADKVVVIALAADASENVLVYGYGQYTNGGYLFKMKATDGSVLP